MKKLLFTIVFSGIALAGGKEDAEAAVKSGLNQCRAERRSCTVTATYTVPGWLIQNGVNVNSTTVTVSGSYEAPRPPSVVYVPMWQQPVQVIVR